MPLTGAGPGGEEIAPLRIGDCTPLPAKIYANEGIAQTVFEADDICETYYADKRRKYQTQRDITLPRI